MGQGIYFNVVGLRDGVTESKAEWTLPGTFVNRQPDPNCLAFYDTDTALLTRSSVTNGALTTSCWYVKDLQNAEVSVKVSHRFGKNGKWFIETITGKFNVHRPTATFSKYDDGTPTVMVVGGILALGNGRTNDMSFKHQINPGNFFGHAGYTQLISGDYTWAPNMTGVPIPIAPNGGTGTPDTELDKQEFPRGQPPIAANTNSPVPFWDGPYAAMYQGYAKEDLHFETYLLFQPDAGPGPNIFVPLRKVTWELHDEANNSTYSNGNPVADPSDANCTAFPQWANIFGRFF